MSIEEILDLEQLEVNIYRGSVFSPESGFLQRTFGGHVAGQSLVSAVRTVDPRYMVHSLHGYFLRPGDAKERTVFLVERIRDGGSFCTRRVNAVQHGETIFSMAASFQTEQEGITHQDVMPAAPPPDGLPGLNSIKVFDDAGFRQFDEWDVCIVPRERLRLLPGKASQQQVWLRHRDPLPDDPVLHICALAYMSDLTLLGSAQVNHLDVRDQLQVASLDHAMWFMRPFRADEWLLYDQSSPSASGGRALTRGEIFTRSGEMVAAVMQEGPEILGRVAGKDREVVTEPGIGLSAAQPRQELRFAQPTPAPRTNRGKHRDRTAADGDGDVLPCPHAAQHAGRIVTQLTRGHLRHAYDRSSIVGQTGCSPDGARAAEVPQPTPGTTGAASVGAEQSRSA